MQELLSAFMPCEQKYRLHRHVYGLSSYARGIYKAWIPEWVLNAPAAINIRESLVPFEVPCWASDRGSRIRLSGLELMV